MSIVRINVNDILIVTKLDTINAKEIKLFARYIIIKIFFPSRVAAIKKTTSIVV